MKSRCGVRALAGCWFGFLSLCMMLGCISTAWASPPLLLPAGLAAPGQQVAMPTFRLPSVDGSTVDSSTLHGKVVVLRFWATW